jgi:hypothetical protein
VIYLATPSTHDVRVKIADGTLGQMITPKSGNRLVDGATFAIDNGRVTLKDGLPITDQHWDEAKWLRCLDRYAGTPGCLFVVVPDEVGDSEATDELWDRYAAAVTDRGYTPAYVTQNGCTRVPAPVVFVGGDDAWKLGVGADALTQTHKGWRHMGRVNSLTRLRYAKRRGYDSVDGTFIARGPDVNLPRLLRYLRRVENESRQLMLEVS